MPRHTGPARPGGKETIAFAITMPGIKPLLRALSQLPKEAQGEIRTAAGRIAGREAEKIRAAAAIESSQAALVADSVRTRRDRVPVILAGGRTKVTTSDGRRIAAGDVFFGAEFGGRGRDTTRQFPAHRGREGYWFFPTLRDDEDDMMSEWLTVVDEIASEWSRDV